MYASIALPDLTPNPAIHSADALRKAVQARPGRIFLNARGLDRVLRYDADRALVEVQAGTRWSALAASLEADHPELGVYRDNDLLPDTVGEWAAVNGPGLDGVPAVHCIEALTMVTPDGELKRVCRASHGELFACAVGGHGIFGVTYSVTVRLGPLLAAARAPGARPGAPSPAAPRDGCRPLTLVVPPDRADELIAEARTLCADWRVDLSVRRMIKTLPEQETRLRWAKAEYVMLSLELSSAKTLGGEVRLGQVKSALIDAAIRHGGAYAVAGTPEASRSQADACYPGLPAFLAEKRRYDPAERLQNAWYRHHRRLLACAECEVRWN